MTSMLPSGQYIPAPKPVDDPQIRVWLARAIAVVLLVGIVSAFVRNANGPADPYLVTDSATGTGPTLASMPTRGARSPFEAFAEVGFTITAASARQLKEGQERCALLADTAVLQAKGMMEQSGFAGYKGMIFKFESENSAAFFMKNTRIPLSIAFFDSDGAFVSSADMEPCPDEVLDCPVYGADRPYLYALEVPKGDLPALGVGAGSTLALSSGGCSG